MSPEWEMSKRWPNDGDGQCSWGYYYLAQQPDDWRWHASLPPPNNNRDRAGTILWTDATVGVIGNVWSVVAHSSRGGASIPNAIPDAFGSAPAGVNSARADLSVSFARYVVGIQENEQPEIEYSVRHAGNPGQIQAKP
jgi:hypothetical protein